MNKLFDKSIQRLKNNNAIFVLSDGYEGWSWGTPVNPVLFTYNEYILIRDFLIKKYNYNLENEICNSSGYDCILADEIYKFLEKRVCQFFYTGTEKDNVINLDGWENILLKTDEEKIFSLDAKKSILDKICNK